MVPLHVSFWLPQVPEGCNYITPKLSLLQAKPTKFSRSTGLFIIHLGQLGEAPDKGYGGGEGGCGNIHNLSMFYEG